MRLSELRSLPDLRLEPIVGEEQLDRVIRWVMTTDMLDPSRYLTGGELVLTGLMWRAEAADSEVFVGTLARAGISALAASDAGKVPEDLIEACRRHGLPLFRVPEEVAFATVTEHVVRRLSAARASDLRAVLDRHRQLVSGMTEGSGLGAVLELVGQDLGMRCWVVSPTGQVISGSGAAPADFDPRMLASQFLTAKKLPHLVREAGVDGERVSLFPVDGDSATRVADWFLVCEGDWREWPAERLALTGELTAIVALERAVLDDRLSVSGRLAQELIRMVVSGSGPAETVPRMQLIGLNTEDRYVAVAATATGGVLRPGELRSLLREVLRGGDTVLGLLDEEVIALLAVGDDPARDLRQELQAALNELAPGLVGCRVGLGVSKSVAATELRSAVDEARYARGLAAGRPDNICVISHDELATHMLLLASVPEDVQQMFRVRLLDPLRTYDEVHRADLVKTLETFLQESGSWTRCAEQMHLHVNSVRYRIQRIEELTGRNLARLEDRVDFFLALRLA